MHPRTFSLLCVIGLVSVCLVNGQSPSPSASASPAKHSRKKAAAEASPASNESPSAEASASPAKKSRKKASATPAPSAATNASPAATTQAPVEPAAKTSRKKTAMTTPAAAAPTASPAKKTLADLFKPKTSPTPVAGGAAKAETTARTAPAPGGGPGMVWVNTESHVYHKEGSRFYGKTAKGKYMSEAEAIKEGNRAAKGND